MEVPGPEHAQAHTLSVRLSSSTRGLSVLDWQNTAGAGAKDWIGLYLTPESADSDYLTWQSATATPPYTTLEGISPGRQARYLQQDDQGNPPVCLVRTDPVPQWALANQISLQDWMKLIPDKTVSLAGINLPGTHDSGAWGTPYPFVNTQGMSIANQLKAGMRYLDIRLKILLWGLELYHGIIDLSLGFPTVLDDVTTFLTNHPSEAVVMSVRDEAGSGGDRFANMVKEHFDRYPGFVFTGDYVPTLAEAAGKIVVLRRYTLPATGFDQGYGLDFTNGWGYGADGFTIDYKSRTDPTKTVTAFGQDFFNTEYDSNKWQAVNKLLEAAKRGSPGDIYLNFASATGSGVEGIYDMAMSVNGKLHSYVTAQGRGGRLGWIPMDWAEYRPGLTYSIVATQLPLRGSELPVSPAMQFDTDDAELGDRPAPAPMRSREKPADAAPGAATKTEAVSLLGLGCQRGWYKLYWEVAPPGPASTWDWVGLYQPGAPDYPWPDDGLWCYVTKGWAGPDRDYSYYTTYAALTPLVAFEARYMAADSSNPNGYKCIVRSPNYVADVSGFLRFTDRDPAVEAGAAPVANAEA